MPTTHTTPIDLRGFHGREFEGVRLRDDKEIKVKGKISVNNDGSVFLCHDDNELNASNFVSEMFGYKFNWCMQRSTESIWRSPSIKSITILDPPSSIDPRWDWKDGEIVYVGGNEHTCHVLKDDLVCFMSHITGVSRRMFRFKVAYDFGYRKLPTPPTRKLTEITEEMFRSTAWYGKKVMYNGVEQGIYAVHYDVNSFTLIQNGEQDYSQCKLIEGLKHNPRPIIEWLNELPELIRELVIADYDGDETLVRSMSMAIILMSSWRKTKMGCSFYYCLYQDALYHEQNNIKIPR